MNKKIIKIVFLIKLSFLIIACGEKKSETPSLSDKKSITSFSINGSQGVINDADKTISISILETDFKSLKPEIAISESAEISPATGVAQDFSKPVIYTVKAQDGSLEKYTVTVSSAIHSFNTNEKKYELIKEAKNWKDAASFAIKRGGYLAEINSKTENQEIFEALEKASIDTEKTIAPDGGNASYVWIGGNDLAEEGNWIWDGNNSGEGTPFWKGDASGSAVGGLYTNWGKEPDDFGTGQDALGFALTKWPLGSAGQWNDVKDSNKLYFLIEFDTKNALN